MHTTKTAGWCVIFRHKHGDMIAKYGIAEHPGFNSLNIALCINKAHARVFLEACKEQKPELYADARIAPVVVEVKEVSREEAGAWEPWETVS